MRPALNLLPSDTVQKIIDEGFALLKIPELNCTIRMLWNCSWQLELKLIWTVKLSEFLK